MKPWPLIGWQVPDENFISEFWVVTRQKLELMPHGYFCFFVI